MARGTSHASGVGVPPSKIPAGLDRSWNGVSTVIELSQKISTLSIPVHFASQLPRGFFLWPHRVFPPIGGLTQRLDIDSFLMFRRQTTPLE